ncbi:DNA cytosine methyltransferase [Nocardia kruczakiae]|uniref:DNA cytosine methyltransferase n=1 Tax=Nocardia kruczakiae TaxID=261477 RepID=UPI0007A46D5D
MQSPAPTQTTTSAGAVTPLTFVDVCAGAGGLASGLERAGFSPTLLLDNLPVACESLRLNRPTWDVWQMDLLHFDPSEHEQTYDVDLLSAGLPRVQAAATVGRSRGSHHELELLKATVWLVHGIQPKSIVIENVSEMVTAPQYEPIRNFIGEELQHLGYGLRWIVLNAADFGVPQDRKQGVLLAVKGVPVERIKVPAPTTSLRRVSVGEALRDSMSAGGWLGADEWADQATAIAPTVVGGSMNRGGADLGPSGTKKAWERMGVYAGSLANEVPTPDFRWVPSQGRTGMLQLTVEQTAILQGFSPTSWQFAGKKTARYRQIGHATPPPVGRALGQAIRATLESNRSLSSPAHRR